MTLANMLSPPPYSRRACCTPWPHRPLQTCTDAVHRFDHGLRTCRCGAQTVPHPEARDGRGKHRRKVDPFSGMGT